MDGTPGMSSQYMHWRLGCALGMAPSPAAARHTTPDGTEACVHVVVSPAMSCLHRTGSSPRLRKCIPTMLPMHCMRRQPAAVRKPAWLRMCNFMLKTVDTMRYTCHVAGDQNIPQSQKCNNVHTSQLRIKMLLSTSVCALIMRQFIQSLPVSERCLAGSCLF